MGNLKPGAKYIYESPDGGKTVYAREMGSDPGSRQLIGYQYDPITGHRLPENKNELDDHMIWNDIRREAKSNTALQKALERAILIYKLSKDYGKDRT